MALQTAWFVLWGILWAVYFMLDGYDFGAGMLNPYLGRSDHERRLIVRAIGPVWNGNEVWLITAGGATFAAFPAAYALMFSSLYLPLLFILFALIFRGVALEFRGRISLPGWKKACDAALFLGSCMPPLLFGVAFGNIFQGLPIDASGYHGSLLTLLNPYGIITGALLLLASLVHGAIYLAMKTGGDLRRRAAGTASALWCGLLIVTTLFLPATYVQTQLFLNYLNHTSLLIIPVVALVALVAARVYLSRELYAEAFIASCLTILTLVLFGFGGLYPNLIPSGTDPQYSLTISNASSGNYTLGIMAAVAAIFVPVVIAYQVWVQKIFSGVVDGKETEY